MIFARSLITRRKLLAVMALFPWFPRSLFATEKGIPSIPPARAFAWDISRKGNTLVQEIRVTEFDAYDIILAFGDINASDENGKLRRDRARDRSWVKLYGDYVGGRWTGPLGNFLGGSSIQYYTKDTNTLVIPHTQEEFTRRDEMSWRGELTIKHSDPGVEIPIRLMVQRIDSGTNPELIFDATISTTGDEGSRLGFAQRFLTRNLRLAPGTYRLTASTLKNTVAPSGVGTYLAIPLRDWKTSRPSP